MSSPETLIVAEIPASSQHADVSPG